MIAARTRSRKLALMMAMRLNQRGLRRISFLGVVGSAGEGISISLNTLDEDHFGMRGGLAEGFGRGVFGRVPPGTGAFCRREFDDDDAMRGPVPFEDFHFAATNEETTAVFFDRGENGFAVVLVTDRIVNFDADDDVGGHFLNGSWRQFTAEIQRRRARKEKAPI